MKKVICAAAAVLMVASLTACSGQSGESAAAGEGNTQQADGYPNKTIYINRENYIVRLTESTTSSC